MKTPETADPADVHVGARIAQLRIARGLTQSDLARMAGPLTFQQFQKYEKGANRVSASRLLQVAVALGVPVAYFFEGLPGAAGPDADGVDRFGAPTAMLQSKHGWALAQAYEAAEPGLRRAMSDMAVFLTKFWPTTGMASGGIVTGRGPFIVGEQGAEAVTPTGGSH